MRYRLFYGLSALLLAGCGREQTRTYQVPKEKSAPPVMQAPAVQTAPAAGFDRVLPSGWAETPGSGMRKVSYTVEGTSIDFYLTALMMGDVPSNVNRWRGQVGLAPALPEEILAEVKPLLVGGHNADTIEIFNAEGGRGIIAAIVDLSPQYWYFTAKGSVDELKAEASNIRKFLESITFEGHSH